MLAYRSVCCFAPLLLLATGCATGNRANSSTTPYGGNPHTIPGLIETEHFDEGKPGEAYNDIDEVNHGAAYRGLTQIDIEQRADASNGYGIGWVRAGEWVAYTVKVAESGTYTVEFPVASQKEGGIFHLEIEGKDLSGPIQIPDTGAWTKLEMIRAHNVRLKAGTHVLRIVMDANGDSGGVGDIDYMRFVKAD
ncbi:MAG: carbohydrate-binding protein [Candidatus Hydrogenedentes bacterium]|nr:carbohydrate-binding protein [Candidatus Hydrogenedentota bacterium]